MSIDREIRDFIESQIDAVLNDPAEIEIYTKVLLKVTGVKPNVDTVLSFILGMIWGACDMLVRDKYKRAPTSEDFAGIIPLMNRRLNELRDAFMNLRLDV